MFSTPRNTTLNRDQKSQMQGAISPGHILFQGCGAPAEHKNAGKPLPVPLAEAEPRFAPASRPYCPSSPAYSPSSPIWYPRRPSSSPYCPGSPNYSPGSPSLYPRSPIYRPVSPVFRPSCPGFSAPDNKPLPPTSQSLFKPSSAPLVEGERGSDPCKPGFSCASERWGGFNGAEPGYSPVSPSFCPSSPAYSPNSPTLCPVSPAFIPSSPRYDPPSSPFCSPTTPTWCRSSFAQPSSWADDWQLDRPQNTIDVDMQSPVPEGEPYVDTLPPGQRDPRSLDRVENRIDNLMKVPTEGSRVYVEKNPVPASAFQGRFPPKPPVKPENHIEYIMGLEKPPGSE